MHLWMHSLFRVEKWKHKTIYKFVLAYTVKLKNQLLNLLPKCENLKHLAPNEKMVPLEEVIDDTIMKTYVSWET